MCFIYKLYIHTVFNHVLNSITSEMSFTFSDKNQAKDVYAAFWRSLWGWSLESIARGWSSEKAVAGECADIIAAKPKNNIPSVQLIKPADRKSKTIFTFHVKEIIYF